ncbi:MAG: glucosamine-6-phosphate synthase, partial [Actinobacteria bacterium]|nr:glucosamine-6-phosphate synthase [Actinomycetota bacterium]
MCGIIAVLSRPETRSVPVAADVLGQLAAVVNQWPLEGAALPSDAALEVMGQQMSAIDSSLRGDAGMWLMAGNREFVAALGTSLDQMQGRITAAENALETSGTLGAAALEHRLGLLTVLRDAVWSIRMDRLRTAAAVDSLAGAGASRSAIAAYLSIQQVFSGIDRLEVRGRDSAGVHVMVWGHGVSADDARVRAMLGTRHDDSLFTSGSVRITRAAWSFVYKAAAEIGELGDNTRAMRHAVLQDDLLRLLVSQPEARVAVLGHTRWASVGIISEPNAHPVNSEELEGNANAAYLIAALNGDVDNHADLRARHELRLAQPITTDAKVIPALVSRRLASLTKDGGSPVSANVGGSPVSADALADAFRETVASFEGSVAIAAA